MRGLFLLLCAVLGTACRSLSIPTEVPSEVEQLTVVRFHGSGMGTAVPLSNRRFITALHALDDANTVTLNETKTSYWTLASGQGGQFGDWVILEAHVDVPFDGAPPRLEPFLPPPGTPLYMMGYPAGPDGSVTSEEDWKNLERRIIPGVAVEPFWMWLGAPRNAIYIKVENGPASRGCSGGLLVAELPETGEFVGVGICVMYRLGTIVALPFLPGMVEFDAASLGPPLPTIGAPYVTLTFNGQAFEVYDTDGDGDPDYVWDPRNRVYGRWVMSSDSESGAPSHP